MKRSLLLGCALLPTSLLAADFNVTAPVSEAVLFPSQAHLTRTLSQSLSAGEHQLVVSGLPELDLDSLQVTVKGARLQGVRQGFAINKADVSARRAELDAAILELEQIMAAAKAADALDQQQIHHLQSLMGQAPQGQAVFAQVPVEKWSSAWASIGKAVEQRQAAINQRAVVRHDQQQKLDALRQERQQLGQGQTRSRELVLTVSADKPSTAKVELKYFTGQAGWQNQLRVDLNSRNENVAVTGIALIHNRTGEDWQNVRATLGLVPAGYRHLPDPAPWIVRLAAPQPEMRKQSLRTVMAEPAAYQADMAESVSGMPVAAPVAHGFDMRVPLSAPLSLASGDASARVSYQQAELPVTLSRESYLWQQPAVLLVGEWDNTSPLPWLAGSVTLLRDGQRLTRYHRQQSIKQGEKVKMSFGDDPRLQITVTREPSREGETGLISKESTLSAIKNITLLSHYDKPITVNLLDRLPVAGNDDITVTAKGKAADAQDVDDVKGLQRWQFTLPAGGEERFKQGFEIRYPAGESLSGVEGL
ncbi:DUF4139 domain-containing protein [uncultured Alcanivorax sp.]|uniref:DUF4139 domain-containing protein n=1 Tax=uncultured Alcanivorax sp. TaxID=191215 RepID=UPI00260D8D6E|nr:DUF4139 domain-containing protein [uncultured Alcanivorax sp.]